MKTSGLRAFLAVVDEGTFDRAARMLGYSQSTVSQQVRSLERDLRGRLLDRGPGPTASVPTSLGRLVEPRARAVVEEMDALDRAASDHREGRGRLVVGTFQATTVAVLPRLVRELLDEDPDRTIDLRETETSEVELDRVDIAFFDSPPGDGAQGRLVTTDEHVLLAAAGTFAAGPVPITRLHRRPLVALPRICDQSAVEDRLAELGVRPEVVFRSADNRALTEMVRAGLGSTVLPTLSVTEGPGLTTHPLRPALPQREIWVQWRGTPSALAERAVELALVIGRDLAPAGAAKRVR